MVGSVIDKTVLEEKRNQSFHGVKHSNERT